jgi:hypothetical protein
LCLEPLEDRRLLAVTLTWPGAGSTLGLTEGTPGATRAVVISEPSPSSGPLKIDLGAGCAFASGSMTSATGLTYQNAGSPTVTNCKLVCPLDMLKTLGACPSDPATPANTTISPAKLPIKPLIGHRLSFCRQRIGPDRESPPQETGYNRPGESGRLPRA